MEGGEQISEQVKLKNMDSSTSAQQDKWVMKESGNDLSDSVSIESLEDSANSISSMSSSDLMEDASSPTSFTSSSSSSNGPLYELSELIAQLPIKRGLSKFYQGKSQSFTSLASVKSLEDLAKKGTPHRLKMKPCKSFGAGLDGHKSYSPKATISKKSSFARGSSLLSSIVKRSTLVSGCRPSIFPLQKNL